MFLGSKKVTPNPLQNLKLLNQEVVHVKDLIVLDQEVK